MILNILQTVGPTIAPAIPDIIIAITVTGTIPFRDLEISIPIGVVTDLANRDFIKVPSRPM